MRRNDAIEFARVGSIALPDLPSDDAPANKSSFSTGSSVQCETAHEPLEDTANQKEEVDVVVERERSRARSFQKEQRVVASGETLRARTLRRVRRRLEDDWKDTCHAEVVGWWYR